MALSTNDSLPALFNIRGRNGHDSPLMLLDGQCREAMNVDWFGSALGRKRGGSNAISLTGGTAFSSDWVRSMGRFVPSDDETAAELFAIDAAGLVKKLAGGAVWANVSMPIDTILTTQVSFAQLNGKFYVAANTGVNRLHVYDPVSAKIRRVGLALPLPPTCANTGVGTYPATARFYRVAYTKQIAGVTVLRSELSGALSFTPSGAGLAARVTKPTTISEDETHWEVYGSADNNLFFLLSTIVVGTTTYDDSTVPSAYDGDTPPDSGSYMFPPSCKFVVADDGRIIMAGAHSATAGVGGVPPSVRRVWWTAPTGSSDIGDDERVIITTDVKSYSDIDEAVSGLSQPVNGAFRVFSYRGQWAFVPTGTPENPYSRYRVTGGAGCISHNSITVAKDASGSPATYWWAANGPYRSGDSGQQYLGQDILDIVSRVNKTSATPIHALYHEEKHQVWFHIPVDGSNIPNMRVVFDTFLGRVVESDAGFSQVRFGWSVHTGAGADAYCSCMFSATIGTAMSFDLKPYTSYPGGSIFMCDTTDLDDEGITYQSYIDGKPMASWGLGKLGGLNSQPTLIANVSPGVTIQLIVSRDEGAEKGYSTVDLSPTSLGEQETMVFPQFGDAALTQANMVSLRVGDASAIANTWNLHAVVLPTSGEGVR